MTRLHPASSISGQVPGDSSGTQARPLTSRAPATHLAQVLRLSHTATSMIAHVAVGCGLPEGSSCTPPSSSLRFRLLCAPCPSSPCNCSPFPMPPLQFKLSYDVVRDVKSPVCLFVTDSTCRVCLVALQCTSFTEIMQANCLHRLRFAFLPVPARKWTSGMAHHTESF